MDTPLRPLRPVPAVVALVVALALIVAGCGGGSDQGSGSPDVGRSDTDRASSGGGMAASSTIASAGEEETAERAVPEASDSTSGGAPSQPVDPTLAAGRVDDGERWEEYLLYREQARTDGIPLAPIDVDARRVVTVVDADDRPVRGAVVDVLDAKGAAVATVRTHADGRAVVFAAPAGRSGQEQGATTTYRVRSEAGTATSAVPAETLAPVLRTDGSRPDESPDLDLHFVVDATGSMGDEIERLKATLATVVEGIGDLPGSPRVRLGMTVYRDQGDAFVTRTVPFTTDAAAFEAELREVTADGGGDTPEAVEPALAAALDGVAWSKDPGTVKLAFLIADAPPHLPGVDLECAAPAPAPREAGPAGGATATDIAPEPCAGGAADDDGPFYGDTATRFAAEGIKVVPVASSNLDPVGESVFRELALVTQAPFLFLTYGADGASPGDERPDLNVDDFAVLSLDQMIATIVAEELESVG